MAELAEILGMDRTTLTAALKPLERRGLLQLEADARDRRARRIMLTDVGRALVGEAVPLWEQAQANVAELLGIVALYYLNSSFRAYVQSISYKHLTIFNVWRFPAGALFLYYGAQGLLPPLFVQNAAWGDILAACLVPVVLMLPESRGKYLWFQVIGFADFILAVGTGLTLNLLDTPTMSNIAELPVCVIPLFGVPITGAVHIMMLDRLLLAGRRASRVRPPAGQWGARS